jgi:hypothetical protein
MTYRFPPNGRIIPVDVVLTGPYGPFEIRLALDTGATRTHLVPNVLRKCGYDLAASRTRVHVNTVGGALELFTVPVLELNAVGIVRNSIRCVVGELPKWSSIHGLLGLDHFEGRKLLLDFARGRIVVGGRMALMWGSVR